MYPIELIDFLMVNKNMPTHFEAYVLRIERKVRYIVVVMPSPYYRVGFGLFIPLSLGLYPNELRHFCPAPLNLIHKFPPSQAGALFICRHPA